jgi:hypothetical protein
MESALGEGGTRLMCSVGKDVMGMDQFGNPDGRLVVNADVPIADHGTWSASATSVFSPTAGVAVRSHAAVLFSVHTTAHLYRDRCSDALSCLLWSDARSRTDDQQPALLSLRPVIAQSTAEHG